MSETIVALVILGLLLFLMRKGAMGCCGGHSHGDRTSSHSRDTEEKDHAGKACH